MTGQHLRNILKDQERKLIKVGERVDYYQKYLRKPLRKDLSILYLLQSIQLKFLLFQEEILTIQTLQIDLSYLLVEKSLQMVFVSLMIPMIKLQDLKHRWLLKILETRKPWILTRTILQPWSMECLQRLEQGLELIDW